MMNVKELALALIIVMSLSLLSGSAAAFSFYGYTKYTNTTALNNTNVTVELYDVSGGWSLNSTYSAVSNGSNGGFFNVSGIPAYQEGIFYKAVVRHYNDSSNTYVDYIGPNLPEFPLSEFQNVVNITFYLKQGATINISAVNATGSPYAFSYQLKDKQLGYSIAEEWNTMTSDVLFHVPANRNYSVMIFPNESYPQSIDINTTLLSGGWYNYTFNASQSMQRLSGYVDIYGAGNFTNLQVLIYLIEPGRMIWMGEGGYPWYNMSGDDDYNTTSGFYNTSVAGPAGSSTALVFAVANKSNEFYGGYKEISLAYGTDPSQTNISLQKLSGSLENTTATSANGPVNITMKKLAFNLINSTGQSLTGFAFTETTLDYNDYNMTNFTVMADVGQSANGTFKLPILNMTGIDRMNIYTMDYAPTKKQFNATQINAAEVNITMNAAFNMEDPDGDVLGNLFIDMVKHNSACDVPSYNATNCSFFGGSQDFDSINPLKIVMSGAEMSFIMRNAANITVHYVNVDLLASGPPDAIFDNDSSDTAGTSAFEQAWKFGSTGPEIYDYVIIGVPYTVGSTSTTGFNESGEINITIPVLYGESYAAAIWNQSLGHNITWISNTTELADYRDYLSTSYESYLNGTGVVCNATDTTLASGLCYKDTAANMLWFKIPHFSGIGPEINGAVITAAATTTTPSSNPSTSSTSGTPSNTSSSTKTFSTITAGKTNSMTIDKNLIHFTGVEFVLNANATNSRVSVSNYNAKPSAVSTAAPGEVFQYLEVETFNVDNAKIDSAKISFRVENDWLTNNSVDASSIKLYRYYGGTWQALTTTLKQKDLGFTFYEASTPGFSTFAIAGSKTVAPAVNTSKTESNETILAQTLDADDSEVSLGSYGWILLVIGIIVLVVMFLYRGGFTKGPGKKPVKSTSFQLAKPK